MDNQEVTVRLEHTRVALDGVRQTLDTAINQISAWQSTPEVSPGIAEMQQHRELLLLSYARYRVLQSDYEALLSLNGRLLRQHQSAKEAYQAGWDAQRIDLEARATDEQYALLRRLFEQIDAEDDLPY